MNFKVSFSGLGINDLPINSEAFNIFGFQIYWYAIIITLGIILAMVYLLNVRKRFGISEDNIYDSLLLGLPLAIIFARIYYVIFDFKSFDSIASMFDIRNGGIAIYGAIIGAAIAGVILWKFRKIDILSMFDLAALGFLIGQSVGRWGNFFNAEVYGSKTSLPWGMTIKTNYYTVENVHPLFLYESIWNLLGFILLHFYSKNDTKRFKGKIALCYVAWYGLGRAVFEGLRNSDYILKLFNVVYISQLVAVLSSVTAIVLIIIYSKKFENSVSTNNDLIPSLNDSDIVLKDLDGVSTLDELDDIESLDQINKINELDSLDENEELK